MKKIYACFVFLTFLSFRLMAAPALLPYPQEVYWTKQSFFLNNVTVIADDGFRTPVTTWLEELNIPEKSGAKRKFIIRKVEMPEIPVNRNEAYKLIVSSKEIIIEAETEHGIFNAVQTLRQLTFGKDKNLYVSGCEITDWPAFRVRGFMHDVGRGYLSVEELKREIELLSRYKINVFHWHLTDNQAWRLECRLFPMLNDSVNMVRLPGKFYTIEDAKELMAFCKQRQVLLIPEIEMPGHSEAFVRTFRHDMQSKEGMVILKLLMDEVCEVFDELPYLHIGTDEVQFTNPAFVPEMVAYLRAKGKKIVSWNPGWSYQEGEIDMLQMWSYRGKPHPGIPVIDSRLHYINHFDAFADLVALFNSNVSGQKQGSHDYAGVIIALWNDRNVESERNIILENGFYPVMLTLAERTWKGGQDEYFYTKGCLIGVPGSEEYHQFEDFENRMLWHKERYFQGYPFVYVRQANVHWRISDPFPNEGDLSRSFPPETMLEDTSVYQGETYYSSDAIGAGIYLRHVWGNNIMPSFYKNPQPNHTAYAWTWVWSPMKQDVGLWACTQNYGRSEKDLPPPQGKWDYKESCIWLNDKKVEPPMWTAAHTVHSNEIPLGNENFEARDPIPVTLQKGWNKVLLKLPVGAFSTPEVRLVKWMFTFVFVTPDGKEAVSDLIYSPDKKK